MTVEPKNRRSRLIASTTFNGIDFVEIASADQKTLRVHFLNPVALQGTVSAVTITGGETIATVKVNPIQDSDWSTEEGHLLLTLRVAAPGDFSRYTLSLTSPKLDAFFSQVIFSFKVLCPSDLDCAPAPPDCPPLSEDLPPIDYLAKDFLSFRRALSDFSALRYPDWQERSEADFGMMFMEALCALADDLSYTQDRIAAEATLETATQRRSILHHARLVDYEPRPATAATTLLQLDVTGNSIASGLIVSAQAPDGATIYFEIGTGLVDRSVDRPTLNTKTYLVDPRWNRHNRSQTTKPYEGMKPYYWDDSQRCLRAGSTDLWIENLNGQSFGFPDDENLLNHRFLLLIETRGATPADPPIREVVRLIKTEFKDDPLFNVGLTHLIWRSEDALQFDRDLTPDKQGELKTIVVGNLVPATQGRRYTETFAIPKDPETHTNTAIPQAIAREGRYANAAQNSHPSHPARPPARIPQYLYTLRVAPLAWLASDEPDLPPLPEILLQPQASGNPWQWRRKLLDAEQFESAFTLDPAKYSRIARIKDGSSFQEHLDYDGDEGDTIRFGDGIFGEIPDRETVFQVTYRVGGGAIGNVAADAIARIDSTALASIAAVTNPFPATGGADREPTERVRRLAPQAFRAKQFRAVRSQDYQAAAQTLPWVQRAGTVFRWTGSWLTVFTTPDPLDSEALTVPQHTQLIDLLNRYRLAGYESYVPSPRYISLDLRVQVCARPDAFRGDVEAALLVALSATRQRDGTTGFFHVDRWTFGMFLERSALESAIQNAGGVAGVVAIQYRQRGITNIFLDLPDTVQIPVDAILRLDNDPSRPERGSLNITVEGGK
ncbi:MULTISPECIES: baseplate J/gp47 family protein [unclassified Microcoleus]|uniref:baseplate J/gp47 family protein n=1 Tax=unclassified Microcoleus TaxID=2642155 RepID=UPI002FD375D9